MPPPALRQQTKLAGMSLMAIDRAMPVFVFDARRKGSWAKAKREEATSDSPQPTPTPTPTGRLRLRLLAARTRERIAHSHSGHTHTLGHVLYYRLQARVENGIYGHMKI
jgi:hypothetical protein